MTNEENQQLAALLGKLTWPVAPEVFDALCENFIATPVELAIVRESSNWPEVFMIYRDDTYFHGWHITGSLILPGRTVGTVVHDIISRELGISLSEPDLTFIRFREFMKGAGPGQSSRGQELSLIHVLRLPEDADVPLDEHRKFFPLSDLPSTTLPHHVVVLEDVREYLAGK